MLLNRRELTGMRELWNCFDVEVLLAVEGDCIGGVMVTT